MTFTVHAACGRLTPAPVTPTPLLRTPTQPGDFDSEGHCRHRAEYRDALGNCGRCGQFEGRLDADDRDCE